MYLAQSRRKSESLLAAAIALAALAPAAHADYTFTFLPGPTGATESAAHGINASGEIVGDYVASSTSIQGSLYYDGAYSTYNEPDAVPPYGTQLSDINSAGSFTGIYNNSSAYQGFEVIGGNVSLVNDPDAVGVFGTEVIGINDSGELSGYYQNSSTQFLGFTELGGVFTAISDPLATDGTLAGGINNEGDIVGFYDVGGAYNGFEYDGTTYTTIDFPGAILTEAVGINDSDEVVGYYIDSTGIYHGFTYDGSTYTSIDAPGSTPTAGTGTELTGINNSGEIVGILGATDTEEAFEATPSTPGSTPEPSPLVVLAVGIAGITLSALRTRKRLAN